jgi:hypothetical protein
LRKFRETLDRQEDDERNNTINEAFIDEQEYQLYEDVVCVHCIHTLVLITNCSCYDAIYLLITAQDLLRAQLFTPTRKGVILLWLPQHPVLCSAQKVPCEEVLVPSTGC